MSTTRECGLTVARRLGELLSAVTRDLADAGIESARIDARLLIARATQGAATDAFLHPEQTIGDDQHATLADLVRRRIAREPMAQILGRRGFRDIELAVTRDVLTPRPETENLVEAVHAFADGPVSRILDLGTGSGCLILSLLSELPGATGVGVDVSEAALGVALGNAASLGLQDRVTFFAGDWFDALPATGGDAGPYDLIVSNPPYVRQGEIADLEPEVRDHEPAVALDGGPDGMDAYRAICASAGRYLRDGGNLGFEVGAGQADAVATLLQRSGFAGTQIVDDLAGIARVVMARWSAGQKRVGNRGEPV
ncbi:MAG: peptide chain release factor N(5)-glutamine methyltransferase [Rhodospirillales bacterium]